MVVALIVAVGRNNEIGLNNKLPWHSPSDLKHFKEVTDGSTLIMGRKTYESLPKLLPNRKHIIVSKSRSELQTDNVMWVNSLEDAIEKCKSQNKEKVFIIGGASIFREAIDKKMINELYITKMQWNGRADTFFPPINLLLWNIHSRRLREPTYEDPIAWEFSKYVK